MKSFIAENWQIISGALGTVGAYFGGRKLKEINEKKANSDALNSMQQAYNEFVIDQKERYSEVREELKFVRNELRASKDSYIELRLELKEERKRYTLLEEKHISLKKEFEAYRKKNDKTSITEKP